MFFGPHRNGWDYVKMTTISIDWLSIPTTMALEWKGFLESQNRPQ